MVSSNQNESIVSFNACAGAAAPEAHLEAHEAGGEEDDEADRQNDETFSLVLPEHEGHCRLALYCMCAYWPKDVRGCKERRPFLTLWWQAHRHRALTIAVQQNPEQKKKSP